MTVKELINELNKFDEDLFVYADTDNGVSPIRDVEIEDEEVLLRLVH